MADVIKIPYGYVIAVSDEEWAKLGACVASSIEFFSDSESVGDIATLEELKQLMFDLITPKSGYGSKVIQ